MLRFSERNSRGIVDVLLDVAKEMGRTPAQVALNWATRRPGITSTILGATKLEQLEDNLGALEMEHPAGALRARLEEAGRPEPVSPHWMLEGPMLRHLAHGGAEMALRL